MSRLRGSWIPGLAFLLSAVVFSPRVRAHGGLHERVAELEKSLQEKPNDARLYAELANVYSLHREWKPALAALAEVERLGGVPFDLNLLRAEVLLGDERPALADSAVNQFLVTHPANLRALACRARCRRARGDADGCRQDYRAALAASPAPEPDLALEAADAFATLGSPDEAIAALDRTLQKIGPVPALLLRALELESAAGRWEAALSRVDAMRTTAPRPEPWMAKRAEMLTAAGRTSEAAAAWQALLAHLDRLPNLERGSHAMSLLAEKAHQAIASGSATFVSSLPSASSPNP